MSNFVPTTEMISAAEKVFAAMAAMLIIRPIVTAYQQRILNAAQFRVREEFAGGLEGDRITNPKNAYLMSESDFADYLAQCEAARISAGLAVKESGNCPLLESEETLRQAERELLDALNPVTHLKAADYCLLGMDKYRECIALSLRVLAPHVNDERAHAVLLQIAT